MIADIYSNVRNAVDFFTHRTFKEHQITGSGFFRTDGPAHTVKAVRSAPTDVIYTGSGVHIADEA